MARQSSWWPRQMPHIGRLPTALAHGVHDVVQGRGVAGAVGEEDRVRVALEQLLRSGRAGVEAHARAARHEVAHDRALDARIEHRDARPGAIAVVGRFAGRHHGREILPIHRRLGLDHRPRLGLREVRGEDPPAHRALLADVAHELARIHAGDRRHAAILQPIQPAALGLGRVLAVGGRAHDRRARPRALRLHRPGAHPVVADVRVGERDQLAREGGIGHRLLIAAHAGGEHHLPHRMSRRGARLAIEARAVREQHICRGGLHLMRPCTALTRASPRARAGSNRADSTVVTTAPARSRRSSPRS